MMQTVVLGRVIHSKSIMTLDKGFRKEAFFS